MSPDISTSELEAYLDEALPTERMARIEQQARRDRALGERLAAINARRDAGVHSLSEIWRRARLSCPSREELGSFLLSALATEMAEFISFHLETTGCRYCQANLDDLRAQQAAPQAEADRRRRKFFQTSAGYLRAKT